MKKMSLVLVFVLLISLTPVLVLPSVDAEIVWNIPNQLTTNTESNVNPSISGDGSKIAFMSNVDGDFEVFVVTSLVNHEPICGSISGPLSGYRQVAYNFTTSGSDPDGDSISYQWYVDGVTQPETCNTLTYTFGVIPNLEGHTISVRTQDSHGAYSQNSTIPFTLINRPPTCSHIT